MPDPPVTAAIREGRAAFPVPVKRWNAVDFIIFRGRFQALLFFLALALLTAVPSAWGAPLYAPQEGKPRSSEQELQKLLLHLGRQQARVVALQRELVSRPALNPEHGGDGEEEKLRWLESYLHGLGVSDVERLDYMDKRVPGGVRGNLIVRQAGLEGRRTLWLVSHLDVAAPGAPQEWKGDPFKMRVEGDLIYGRGVEDNHQAVVVGLLLLQALRETGIKPPLNLGLLFCPGALTGYDMNIEHLLRQKPGVFAPGDLVLLMDYGSENGSFIEVAEKTDLWFKVTVSGREGHAGSPQEAVNAFTAAAALVRELEALEAAFPAQNPLFSPPQSTFTPTLAENSSKGANHIPGRFAFYLDARLLPEYEPQELEKILGELAETTGRREGVEIRLELTEQTPRAPETPQDSPVVRALGRAIREQLGVEPVCGGIGGVTMASAIRAGGTPVAVWGIQKNWRNKAEEFASIKDHLSQAKVAARLLYYRETAPKAAQ